MPDHHPISPLPRLADAALAALGGPMDEDDFMILTRKGHATIHATLLRLKQLEDSNG